MINTLEQLLYALSNVTGSHQLNKDIEVRIEDADTRWHMKISNFKWSEKDPKRLLLVGEGYETSGPDA